MLTNSPIYTKFGTLVHFDIMYVHIDAQVPTCYSLDNIAENAFLGVHYRAL